MRPTPENARRVFAALRTFKAPLFDLAETDLLDPDVIYQIGVDLGIEEFVRNKRASGRPKDRADLILIGRG